MPARQRRTWMLEMLEGRDLLSVAPILFAAESRAAAPVQTEVAGTAQPTPHEAAREKFVAKFSGPFVAGPGRFTDQSLQTFLYGGGTSSAFLHGNFKMAIFSPVDPTRSVTGNASLFSKNISSTGSALILDLHGMIAPGTTSAPTHLTWTVDPDSGGDFTNAVGSGTVDIHYARTGKLPQRATAAGRAFVIFHGTLQTTGTNNIISTQF